MWQKPREVSLTTDGARCIRRRWAGPPRGGRSSLERGGSVTARTRPPSGSGDPPVSYGHAESVARAAQAAETDRLARVRDDPAVRSVLAERDIAGLFRAVNAAGVSQRRIAELVGMAQSEVSDILDGRRVLSYEVLVRIADGLGVPRGMMGLSFGAYAGHKPPDAEPPEDLDMLRRSFLAAASAAVFGEAILGTEATIAAPGPAPLPSRVGSADVEQIRTLTAVIRDRGRLTGGQGRVSAAVARESARLTAVPATDPVKRDLLAALSDQQVEAGWCCFDDGMNRHADALYRDALSLAKEAGDGYGVANTLRHAGFLPEETGAPNDAIKLYQVAGVRIHRHPNRDHLLPWLEAQTATALVHLGRPEMALEKMARVRDAYAPSDPFEAADLDLTASLVALGADDLDGAEPLARSAVEGFGESRRGKAFALAALASSHRHERDAEDLRTAATRAAVASGSRRVTARGARKLALV